MVLMTTPKSRAESLSLGQVQGSARSCAALGCPPGSLSIILVLVHPLTAIF